MTWSFTPPGHPCRSPVQPPRYRPWLGRIRLRPKPLLPLRPPQTSRTLATRARSIPGPVNPHHRCWRLPNAGDPLSRSMSMGFQRLARGSPCIQTRAMCRRLRFLQIATRVDDAATTIELGVGARFPFPPAAMVSTATASTPVTDLNVPGMRSIQMNMQRRSTNIHPVLGFVQTRP